MPEDQKSNPVLSKKQRDKFIDWLKTKGPQGKCTVCGSNSWTIGNHLLSGMIVSDTGELSIGGTIYPAAFVVCNKCAYVRQFMAVPIGLVEGDKTEDPSDG